MRSWGPARVGAAVMAVVVGAGIATTAGIPAAGAATYRCPPADPVLEAAPADLAPFAGVTLPVRSDADGTIAALAVEDPGGPAPFTYTPVYVQGADRVEAGGVFAHPWPTARSIVTYGVYTTGAGGRTRVPIVAIENGPAPDLITTAMAAFMREARPVAGSSSTYALNTVAPTAAFFSATLSLAALLARGSTIPLTVGPLSVPRNAPLPADLLDDLARAWMARPGAYPDGTGFSDEPPLYIWSTFRRAPAGDVWQGTVVMHNGGSQATVTGREACRRTRVGGVARTSAGTSYLGGMYLLDKVTGDGTDASFHAHETITAGVTAAAGTSWVDTPIASIVQDEHKDGTTRYTTPPNIPVDYATRQSDTIAVGVQAGDTFFPLAGTRADTVHAAAPDAERRVVSVGVFDPLGGYHPAAGVREHFERFPADVWISSWAGTGGPGAQVPGDWQIDAGVFDPFGAFVGLVRTQYDDAFAGARDQYQMMISAGALVAERYVPVVATTYDGGMPLETWVLGGAFGVPQLQPRWMVTVGAFDPLGAYRPVAGASYYPGGAASGVDEEYRVGVFPGDYHQFVPVAGARWRSDRPSLQWATQVATSKSLSAPSAAQLDVGASMADGTLVPVAGVHAFPGQPDRYEIGAWAGSGFLPLLTACQKNVSVGVGVGNGPCYP